jgi:hypothetical protein
MTLAQWAEKRNISVPTAHKIINAGLGPEVFQVPGIRGNHVTPAADLRWEKKMYALRKSKEVKHAAAQRRKNAEQAGRIAAESPLHVSKTGKPKRGRPPGPSLPNVVRRLPR